MKSFKILILALLLLVLVPAVHAQDYDIVLSRGDLPVDLLVAQVYTQKAGIPLITVSKEGLNQELVVELSGYKQQGYDDALIIGGAEAVPNNVEISLIELNYSVTRLWDWNRYGTAARVALSLWNKTDTVVVAQGDQKGVLVSAARTAINSESPLLLTRTDELPSETKQAIQNLGATRIILLGEVSDNVRTDLSTLGGVEETRFREINIIEPGSSGIFIIGLIVGALIIFLLSSLWGAGILGRKVEVPYSILQDDEQLLIDTIQGSGGAIKQQEIPERTSFSRPKVSRLVSELEKRGIIYREKVGKTYVLKLGKKIGKRV